MGLKPGPKPIAKSTGKPVTCSLLILTERF